MKHARTVALAVLVAALQSQMSLADTPSGVEIDISVSTLSNQVGALGCRLFADPKGFPEKQPWVTQTSAPIRGKTQTCHFSNVAAGTYAIAVMHDENGNGELDKNFFGKPVEGYGVSNNHTSAFKAPTWEQAKFVVVAGKPMQLSISLRY